MKLSHILFAGLLVSSAGYVSAQAPTPPVTAEAVEAVTPAEQAALQALQQALAAAATPEEKAQILADAIAATPTLASNPALSSAVQSTAIQSGLSVAQVNSAIITGLSNATAPAAGGPPAGRTGSIPTPPAPTAGGGGGGSPS